MLNARRCLTPPTRNNAPLTRARKPGGLLAWLTDAAAGTTLPAMDSMVLMVTIPSGLAGVRRVRISLPLISREVRECQTRT
jgi:hypothetical protein